MSDIFNLSGYGYLECRGFGHNWGMPKIYNDPLRPQSKSVRFLIRVTTCTVCWTTKKVRFRHQTSTVVFERKGVSMIYPEDYAIPGVKWFVARRIAQGMVLSAAVPELEE